MKKLARVAFVLSITLVAGQLPAAGTPKGAPVGYEAKYKEVLDAEKSEEYEKALTLLEQIPPEKATVYVRLKRASLLVRLGKFVEAESILTALLKDPAADAIRATVQGDLDDLRARMPKLTIRLADSSKSDAWVTVDDKPVGPPVTLPLNPGTHVVVAKKNDVEVFRQKVTLQDSQNLEIEIDTSIAPPVGSVSAAKPPAVTTPISAPQPPKPPTPDQPRGTIGSAPFFVGGAVFAMGSVAAFLLAASSQSAVRDNCHAQSSPTCDTDAAGASKIRTWETVGWLSGGIALASFGLGVVFATSGSTDASRSTATMRPLPGGASVSWETRF